MPESFAPGRVPPPAFDDDTLEGRALRAEAAASAAIERAWELENELHVVDNALDHECVPRDTDGTHLTRMGRIRAQGDARRRVERELRSAETTLRRLHDEFTVKPAQPAPTRHGRAVVLPGQTTVDECIAKAERTRSRCDYDDDEGRHSVD